MEIKELKNRPDIDQNNKLYVSYAQFDKLLMELRTKDLPNETVNFINDGIDRVNSDTGSEKELSKHIKNTQSRIIKLIEKEHKLVTKNHYRNTWLAVGMSVFGIPIGLLLFDNIGIGLPMGMLIGIVIGSRMDKKAFNEGRQLNL
jgi:hypothetical protein